MLQVLATLHVAIWSQFYYHHYSTIQSIKQLNIRHWNENLLQVIDLT